MGVDFTDIELRQIAAHVARVYLEVERGLRPKRALRSLLSPDAYDQQHSPQASRFVKGGLVRQDDIGRIFLQRAQPHLAYAAIPARQHDDRWGALMVEFRANDRGVWRVTELTRAQDRNLTPERPEAAPPTKKPTAKSRRHDGPDALIEARGAREAAAQRYTHARQQMSQLAPETAAAQLQTGDVVNIGTPRQPQWATVARRHCDEASGIVTLTVTQESTTQLPADRALPVLQARAAQQAGGRTAVAAAGDTLADAAADLAGWDRQVDTLQADRDRSSERADQARPDQPTPIPTHLVRTLGNPPGQPAAHALWDTAAEVLSGYRDRWNITTTSALGPQPADSAQRADRARTVATLRDLTRQLTAHTAQPDQRPGTDRNAETDRVDAGPFVEIARTAQ